MSALLEMAKLFGVRVDDTDAAMRSERGYRAAISRRNLLAVGGALAAGSLFSFPSREWMALPAWFREICGGVDPVHLNMAPGETLTLNFNGPPSYFIAQMCVVRIDGGEPFKLWRDYRADSQWLWQQEGKIGSIEVWHDLQIPEGSHVAKSLAAEAPPWSRRPLPPWMTPPHRKES